MVEQVALTRLQIGEASLPLGIRREDRKAVLALNHIARFGVGQIVGQSLRNREIAIKQVRQHIPTRLQVERAVFRGERRTLDLRIYLVRYMEHIDATEIERGERTIPCGGAAGGGVLAICLTARGLDDVARCPIGLRGEHTVDIAAVGRVDIERVPVPTLSKRELLYLALGGGENHCRIGRAAVATLMLEQQVSGGIENVDLARAILPQTHLYILALHFLVAVDGHIDMVLSRSVVVGDVGLAHAAIVDESSHDIVDIGIKNSVLGVGQFDLTDQRHGHRQLLVVVLPRANRLDLDGERQALVEVLVVLQIDILGMLADIQSVGYREMDGLRRLRRERTLRRHSRQPRRQRGDGILARGTARVGDSKIKLVLAIKRRGDGLGVLRPTQLVAVYINRPRERADQLVAVQVLHIANRDKDVLLVDFLVEHLEVDHQLVAIASPSEVVLLARRCVTNWRKIVLIHQLLGIGAKKKLLLVDHLAVAISEDTRIVRIVLQLEATVVGELLLAERQVGNQTQLLAGGRHIVVGHQAAGGQCLLVENDIVEVSGEGIERLLVLRAEAVGQRPVASTEPHIVARETAQLVGCKSDGLLAIDKDICQVVGAADGINQVVPLLVGIRTACDMLVAPVTQHDVAVLQTNEEFSFGVCLRLQTITGGEECGGIGRLLVGLEPEHKREVLFGRTSKDVLLQLHTAYAVGQMKRHVVGQRPRSALQRESSTVGKVGTGGADAIVHAVVSHQFRLETGEVLLIGKREFVYLLRIRPNTSLKHIAVERLGAVERVTEQERSAIAVVRHGGLVGASDFGGAGIETNDARGVVGHGAACEIEQRLELLRLDHRIAYLRLQAGVCRQRETKALLGGTQRENGHRLALLGGTNHSLDGESTVVEIAVDKRLCHAVLLARESQRSGLRDIQIVGAADDLEIGVLVQIVAGDRLAETNGERLLDGQNSIRRGRNTEYLRTTGVLGALQHGRRIGDKTIAVASVGDGTQFVLLLHRVAVAIEANPVDATARNL